MFEEVALLINMTYSLFIKRMNGRIKNDTIYKFSQK